MDHKIDQPDAAADHGYEPPSMIELGSVVETTQGSGRLDTADMKQWYN